MTLSADEQVELDPALMLHRAVYRHFVDRYHEGVNIPLTLTTYCDAPVGSGLGASSTLVVAMIRVFSEFLNIPLDDYAIAGLAYDIEREVCGLAGGRQDQFSACFGGFNFMEFYSEKRALVNSLRIKNHIICELEASLVLFYTGVSRESARIISDQSRNVSAGQEQALEAMQGLKQEALSMKESLLKGDFEGIVESMRLGWENKKRSAATVSNPHIEQIYSAATAAGASAGKVSGAGGGGFMLFFVNPESRMDVIRAPSRFEGQSSNCHFTKTGAQAWSVK